jgi:amidase
VLRGLGATVEPVEFGWSAAIDRAAQDYLDHLFGAYIASYVDTDPSLASEWAKYCAEAHKRVTPAKVLKAYEAQDEMAHRVGRILEDYNAFICPAMGTHEVPADHEPDQPILINGKSIDVLYGWCLSHPFNMLGRCPVLAVPSGMAGNGLPTGIQIVARHLDDVRVFRVGKALERAQPWLDCAERRPPL